MGTFHFRNIWTQNDHVIFFGHPWDVRFGYAKGYSHQLGSSAALQLVILAALMFGKLSSSAAWQSGNLLVGSAAYYSSSGRQLGSSATRQLGSSVARHLENFTVGRLGSLGA